MIMEDPIELSYCINYDIILIYCNLIYIFFFYVKEICMF